MSTTLTISDLDDPVREELQRQAAIHGRSMEAEARQILIRAFTVGKSSTSVATEIQCTPKVARSKIRGIWKGGPTTDEILKITRGD